MSNEPVSFAIPQSLTHHEYTHRMMRLLSTIHMMKVKEGFPRDELLIRSCMMSNILVAGMMDKLVIEAGTLSFVPQYCDMETRKGKAFVKTLITENFGKNRMDLVLELEELRSDFINNYEVKGYSMHAKNIYAVHVYLDLVNMLNPNAECRIVDGELFRTHVAKKNLKDTYATEEGESTLEIHKGEEHVIYDGSPMHLGRYYSFMVDMAQWKLGELHYVGANIRQAVDELCLQIRKQKGFIVG